MSGVAKHEKASRNAKPRRRCLRLRPPVTDSFEQRQIACRLTDNRINDCSSLPSSSSSSLLSFFIVMVSFSGPLILEENIASGRRNRHFTFEVLLRPFFYPASQTTTCLPLLMSSSFEPQDEWRVVRKEWNPRGRLCPSQRKGDYGVEGKS